MTMKDEARRTNRHPADELADVRAQIAALEKRQDELRRHLMANRDDLVGDEFEAEIQKGFQSRLNKQALKDEVGDAVVERHTKPVPVTYVRTNKR